MPNHVYSHLRVVGGSSLRLSTTLVEELDSSSQDPLPNIVVAHPRFVGVGGSRASRPLRTLPQGISYALVGSSAEVA